LSALAQLWMAMVEYTSSTSSAHSKQHSTQQTPYNQGT
jgi:hypothetical protein